MRRAIYEDDVIKLLDKGWKSGVYPVASNIHTLPSAQPKITNEEIRFALKQLRVYFLIKIRDKKEGNVPVELLQRIEEIQEYVDNLPSAQSEQRWIPVTKRLPGNEDVLIQFPSNMAVGRYCGEWRINSGGNWETEICVDDEKPIAWMLLPEPWKGDTDD